MSNLIDDAIGWVVTAAFGIVGWVFSMLFKRQDHLQESHDRHLQAHAEFKEKVVENYALKNDMEKGFDRVISKLDLIFEKLDGKADKEP